MLLLVPGLALLVCLDVQAPGQADVESNVKRMSINIRFGEEGFCKLAHIVRCEDERRGENEEPGSL